MRLALYEMSQSVLDTMADATMAVLAWLGLNTEYWPPVLGVALFVWCCRRSGRCTEIWVALMPLAQAAMGHERHLGQREQQRLRR